jgi:hypothetical protein
MFTLFNFVSKILDISWIPNWECILRVPWVFPFHSFNVFKPFFLALVCSPFFFALFWLELSKPMWHGHCVRHQIGICPDVSIVFVKTNAWKQLFSPRLPLLWLTSKNEFQLSQDRHFLVVIGLVTKKN